MPFLSDLRKRALMPPPLEDPSVQTPPFLPPPPQQDAAPEPPPLDLPATKAYEQHVQQGAPVHKDKWYQRLGHAVGLSDEITHPTLSRQREDFGQRAGELKEVANIEQEMADAQRKQAVAQAQIGSANATAEWRRAQQDRLNRPEQPKPLAPPSTEEAMLVRTLSDPNASPEEKQAARRRLDVLNSKPPAREPAGRNRTPEDVLMDPNASPEQKSTAQRILNQKLARRGRSGDGQPPRASQSSFRIIESEKQRALATAEELFRKGDMDEAELSREKQRIQDAYEAQVDAAGGTPQHMEYSPVKPKTPTPPAIPPPPPPNKVAKYRDKKTGEIRQFMGVTPEDHVDAYKKGYELVP
jgi:hypothetical protein